MNTQQVRLIICHHHYNYYASCIIVTCPHVPSSPLEKKRRKRWQEVSIQRHFLGLWPSENGVNFRNRRSRTWAVAILGFKEQRMAFSGFLAEEGQFLEKDKKQQLYSWILPEHVIILVFCLLATWTITSTVLLYLSVMLATCNDFLWLCFQLQLSQYYQLSW